MRYRTGESSDGSSSTRIPAMPLRERHRLHHRSIPTRREPGGGETTDDGPEQQPAQAIARWERSPELGVMPEPAQPRSGPHPAPAGTALGRRRRDGAGARRQREKSTAGNRGS